MKRKSTKEKSTVRSGEQARSRTISVRMGEPLLSIFCSLAMTHGPVSEGKPELSAFLRRIVQDWVEWHAGEHQLRQPPLPDGTLHRRRKAATAAVQEMIERLRDAGEAGPALAATVARLWDLLCSEYLGR